MNNFVTRTLAGAVFAVVVIGACLWNTWSLFGLTLIISTLGLYEYLKLINSYSARNWLRLAVINLLILLSVQIQETVLLGMAGLIALFIITEILFSKQLESGNFLSTLTFGLIYITLPLALFTVWANEEVYDFRKPLLVFFLVWSSDTFAYLTGRALGKRPLFEALSPKKTLEGFAGGTLLTAALGAWLCPHWGLSEWWQGMILGGLTSFFGTAGDLFQSSLKRKAGVKDSGKIIPGHGGILDRFDAFLFVCVLIWIWHQFMEFFAYIG